MKTCARCKESKSEDAFSVKPNGKLVAWCKVCHSEYAQDRAARLRELEGGTVKVYALRDPRTNEVRYIGATSNPLAFRVARHLKPSSVQAFIHRPLQAWIAEVQEAGLQPVIELVAECDPDFALDAERGYIAYELRRGARLTNVYKVS